MLRYNVSSTHGFAPNMSEHCTLSAGPQADPTCHTSRGVKRKVSGRCHLKVAEEDTPAILGCVPQSGTVCPAALRWALAWLSSTALH